MINVIKKFINIIGFSFIFFLLSASLSYSDIKIIDIKNTVHVLDIYGKGILLINLQKLRVEIIYAQGKILQS